jgi:mercuric ion binding protein
VGNLQVLAPFRPLFLAGAGLALLVAGRRIFHRAPACAPGTACSVPAIDRASKAVFAIVTLLVVLAAAFPYLVRPAQADRAVARTTRDLPPRADAAASGRTDLVSWRTVTLSVPGMSCHTCPITVRKALLAVHGVTAAEVSLERKTVLVTFDATKTTVAALTHATVDAGYPSSLQGEVTQ